MRTRLVVAALTALMAFGMSAKLSALETRLIDYRIELHFGWPLSGKISERLRQLGDGSWQLERDGLVFGFTATEVSKFKIMGAKVQSMWYRKKQSGIPSSKMVEISFPSGNTELFDPITLAVKIGADLHMNPNLQTANYQFSEKQGKEKPISFRFVHDIMLDTDIGEIAAVRVEQVSESDDDAERTYWLSPDYDYIILRAIEREDGDIKTEINIRNGSVGGRPLKAANR